MNKPYSLPRPAMAGLSLIELMIAMAIGLVLLLGLVQVMAASRAAYQLSSGVARTQENARFAMESLQRDLRMAGHLGCVNDQARMQEGLEGVHLKFLINAKNYPGATTATRFDMGIQGFEANNTAPGNSFTLPAATVAATGPNLWSPSLPADILALRPVANSDIVALRYFSPAGVGIQNSGFVVTGSGGVNATITPVKANTEVTLDLAKDATALFGIADCSQATVFSGKLLDAGTGAIGFAASPAGINKSGFSGLETYQPSQAVLYRAQSLVYYVGVGAGGGPSLFRASANGAGTYVSEELVEGVESLQLLYGRDQSAVGTRPTGYISRNGVASGIGGASTVPTNAEANDWRRVGMVQVGMLMRSSDPAAAAQASNNPSALGVRITPSGTGGGYYRSVYESSVALRNRLYGN
ncbi:MAG: PilW family protein [Stenotrophomonas sp.]